MNIKEFQEFDSHEKVVQLDLNVGDKKIPAIIAIHRINGGKAIGGTRMLEYHSLEEATKDALNLSRSMTYKCLLSNIPYGGGKGVIFADPDKVNMQKTLKEYAMEVNRLGFFYTGEDVGLSKEAVEILGEYSPYIIGLPNKTGIPAPYAADGVFAAIEGALDYVFGSRDFSGKIVAVKGLGAVGAHLVEILLNKGAKVLGADIIEDRVAQFKDRENFKATTVDGIHKEDVDVYSPCALGYDLTSERVKELSCKIVCGAANNQLAAESVADKLFDHNVIYVPDYVANAGGLIHVADELEEGGYSKERVQQRISEITERVIQILDNSSKKGLNHNVIAMKIAERLNDQ